MIRSPYPYPFSTKWGKMRDYTDVRPAQFGEGIVYDHNWEFQFVCALILKAKVLKWRFGRKKK